MRIETANIKCEFCDSVFDSSYDPNYDARIENLIKPYAKDRSRIYNLSYKDENKFHRVFDENKHIQLLSNLKKKYSKRFKEYRIKSDYICKNCERFSANLYNALSSIEFRLREMRKLNRSRSGVHLEYFGIVLDSKYQLYSSINNDFQYKLDYISGRFLHELVNPNKKYFSVGNFDPKAKISYERCETFSFNHKNLKFLFTGIFTTEIKNCLIEKTIEFIDHIISLDIVNLTDINVFDLDKSEIEKFNSYIFILEDIFFFMFMTKNPNSINRPLNHIYQKMINKHKQ
jgi:hypothetical protein